MATRVIHRENAASTSASRTIAIQRQSEVSISFQFTSSGGRYFSIGELLEIAASFGIRPMDSGANSHTCSPERNLVRSNEMARRVAITQKSAWLMIKRIRWAMDLAGISPEELIGKPKCTEASWCGVFGGSFSALPAPTFDARSCLLSPEPALSVWPVRATCGKAP